MTPFPSHPDWSDARYRAIVENQTELICCYLPDGRLTYANSAYLRFFGVQREDVIGRPFFHLLEFADQAGILEHIQWQVKHKTPRTEIQQKTFSDGRTFIVEWTDQALLDEAGNLIEILAVGRDATERIRAEDEHRQLEIARAELAAERNLNSLRDSLLHIVTHELRTPLAMIQSSADMLLHYHDRMSHESRRDRLDNISDKVRLITTMLDEIAFSLQLQMSQFTVRPSVIYLEAFAYKLINELKLTMGQMHRFRVHVDPSVQEAMLDEVFLHRIMVNLLTNAIKYSPPGTLITVDITQEDFGLTLQVEDQGMGIAAVDQERVFEPFFRGGNVGSIPGTGLGLSLVRECVTALGGSLKFDSALGRGTRFVVTLPQVVSA